MQDNNKEQIPKITEHVPKDKNLIEPKIEEDPLPPKMGQKSEPKEEGKELIKSKEPEILIEKKIDKEEILLKSIQGSIIKNDELNKKNFKEKNIDESDPFSGNSLLDDNFVVYDETTNTQFHKENKRKLKISIPKKVYGNNSVIYRKYTNLNFFIINLFEQFSKPVNIYFLFLAILQFIPRVSVSGENPTILIPLFFILIFQMMKDLMEDLRINKLDKKENSKKIEVIRKKAERIMWKDLYPGEVIAIKENESVPADCLLLYSSNVRDDCCYVDVSNISGQSMYEKKNTVLEIDNFADESPIQYITSLYSREIEFEKENKNFYSFKGNFLKENGDKIRLKMNNLLLRGSVVKNTDYIYCVVLYSGYFKKNQM